MQSAALLIVSVAVMGVAPQGDRITPALREALARIVKVQADVDQKEIDEAIEALHGEIARQAPEVFVPLAIPHLMRLAPKDTRTRVVLRRAMKNGWIEEALARAYLVRAGDRPGPHVNWLAEALGDKDPKVRQRAMDSLGACGAAAESALPKLRAVIEKAKADPDDFRRDYTLTSPAPEHVHAYWALIQIEAAAKKRR